METVKEKKKQYRKCGVCQAETETSKLYLVPHIVGLPHVKMCMTCGESKIAEWNKAVVA